MIKTKNMSSTPDKDTPTIDKKIEGSARNWLVPAILYAAVLSVFIIRTILAFSYTVPRLFELFNLATLLISGGVLIRWYSVLTRNDLLIVLLSGSILGILVTFTSFYPLLNLSDPFLVSIGHGASLAVIFAAGLALMRKGGPVSFDLALKEYKKSMKGMTFGLVLGFPFAIINLFAFSMMQGQPIILQNPLFSAIAALQPGFVEEVLYRLTFLSLAWIAMKNYLPSKATPLAAFLAFLVHNYSHLGDLFVVQPLFALIYGAIMGLLFGLPPTLLALRKNLEAAIAFHWIVDFIRFFGGF